MTVGEVVTHAWVVSTTGPLTTSMVKQNNRSQRADFLALKSLTVLLKSKGGKQPALTLNQPFEGQVTHCRKSTGNGVGQFAADDNDLMVHSH